jgi:predicted DNA-binding transcriptional regulator AlpA
MPSPSTSTLESATPNARESSVTRFLTVAEGMEPELLDAQALARRWSTSVRTIRRLIAGGGAPRPVRISAQVIRWRLSEVRRWEAAHEKAARSQGTTD